MKSLEKWTDRITLALMLAVAAIDFVRADYGSMLGFICAALWVCVAAIRRTERDLWRKSYERTNGTYEEDN